MTGIGDGESGAALAEERLRRTGLQGKLDKGFAEGTYCVYVEFDDEALQQLPISQPRSIPQKHRPAEVLDDPSRRT